MQDAGRVTQHWSKLKQSTDFENIAQPRCVTLTTKPQWAGLHACRSLEIHFLPLSWIAEKIGESK